MVKKSQEETKKEIEELQLKARELKKTLPKKFKAQPLPKSMRDEEFTKLIKLLPNNKRMKESKVAFLIAYESGLRISEIKSLKKEQIDIKSKRIIVERGKFSKDRVVPLPKTWKGWMIDFIPIKKSVRSLERNFKTASEKAGLNPRFVFHSLRHSFATNCLQRGMPINQVQLFMGHASIGTTSVYLRANPEEALRKYEEIF